MAADRQTCARWNTNKQQDQRRRKGMSLQTWGYKFSAAMKSLQIMRNFNYPLPNIIKRNETNDIIDHIPFGMRS